MSARDDEAALVLVGAGQVRNRPGLDTTGAWDPREPAQLMAEALEHALRDTGVDGVAAQADLLGCVPALAWVYDDLPGAVAARLGVQPAEGLLGSWGGESPVQLLNDVATRVRQGDCRIALLAGAETMYSRRRARTEGRELSDWSPRAADVRQILSAQKPFANPLEMRHGLERPTDVFPLYENALRARAGRSIEAHQVYQSELMARYSEVAAANPMSWFPEPRTAEEIREVGPDNRMICFPYPKLMNALMSVDQAAALVVMRESEADRLGIPPQRRVRYLGGAGAHDAWNVTERVDLESSPAYAAAARRAAEHAGIGVDDVDLFDLYSCFPSAVELATLALGIGSDDPRSLTQTGGLAHHGGPGNDYAMHAIANTFARLRDGAGRVGWVSGLGMSATKHAIAVLGGPECDRGASDGRATQLVLPEEERTGPDLVEAPDAPGRVESYTLKFARDGEPERSIFVVRLDDGRRTLANGEPSGFAGLLEAEGVGLHGTVTAGTAGGPNLFAPDP